MLIYLASRPNLVITTLGRREGFLPLLVCPALVSDSGKPSAGDLDFRPMASILAYDLSAPKLVVTNRNQSPRPASYTMCKRLALALHPRSSTTPDYPGIGVVFVVIPRTA